MQSFGDVEREAQQRLSYLEREDLDPGLAETLVRFRRALLTGDTAAAHRIAKGIPYEALLASDASDEMVQRVAQWGTVYFNSDY